MPASWIKEKVEEPTADCVEYTKRLIRHLFVNYCLIPHKVAVSKDGGLLAVFKQPFGKNILRVEVDNELDAVAVVTDGDSILNSGLLEQDDQEANVIETFVGGVA